MTDALASAPGSPPEPAVPRRRIGVVLAGGGEVGVGWHAAVLEALSEWSGFEPGTDAELIVGTSAGAWIASLLRAGMGTANLASLAAEEEIPSPDDVVARFGTAPELAVPPPPWPPWPPSSPRLVREALRRDVSAGSVFAGLMPEGKLDPEPVIEGIARLHGDTWPSAPLWLCAVDLETGLRTVFGRDGAPAATVAEAVAASCAVPAYFSPVVIGGRRYIDGGAHSIANLDLCAGLDLDLVIVSFPLGVAAGVRGLSGGLAARRTVSRRLEREAVRVRASGTPVVIAAPALEDLAVLGPVSRAMDRARRPRVVEHVRRTAARRLAQGLLGRELVGLQVSAAPDGQARRTYS
jgi:NTE family protein